MAVHLESGHLNPWRNTHRILFEPLNVMESLVTKANWFPAWCTAVVLTALTQIPAVLRYTHDVNQLVESGHIPAEVARMQQWLTIISNTLNPPLSYLGQALLYAIVLAFLAAMSYSAKQGFGIWFGVAMWSIMPAATAAAIFKAIVLAFYDGPPLMVYSGPAVFLPVDAHGLLKTFLVTLDIFSLWIIVLCAVGVYALNGRRFRPAAVSAVLLFVSTLGLNYLTWK